MPKIIDGIQYDNPAEFVLYKGLEHILTVSQESMEEIVRIHDEIPVPTPEMLAYATTQILLYMHSLCTQYIEMSLDEGDESFLDPEVVKAIDDIFKKPEDLN